MFMYNQYGFNYQYRNGIAYTEDMVEVYNLFLFNLSSSICESDLYNYFSQYGRVVYVHIGPSKDHGRDRKSCIGFVYFEDPRCALKALKSPHRLHGKLIGAQAANSWRQPRFAQQLANSINYWCDTVPKLAGLAECSDALLMEVHGFLKLRDKINLARSWSRFREIFVRAARLQYKAVEFEELKGLTLWQIRCFFQMIGHWVESVTTACRVPNRVRICIFVSSFCPNMKRLVISHASNWYTLRHILVPTIESLELRHCALTDLDGLAKLKRLRVLTMIDCYRLKCMDLVEFRHISQLTVYETPIVERATFVEILRTFSSNLTVLNLQRCMKCDNMVLKVIAHECRNLETLELNWTNNDFGDLVCLPKLRSLELLSDYQLPLSDSVFQAFSSLSEPKLQHLKLLGADLLNEHRVQLISRIGSLKYFSCSQCHNLTDDTVKLFARLQHLEVLVLSRSRNITGDGLLHVVANCTHLNKLHIQHCGGVSRSFVGECANLVKDRLRTNYAILRVYCFKTPIAEMPDDTAYPFLKLDFRSPDEHNIVHFGYATGPFRVVKNENRFDDFESDSDSEEFKNVDISDWISFLAKPDASFYF